ncbi:MAG: phage N-6-adenine-methyltransferase [Clostridiales bacterium]|nr:phage N-6-adenine-methyltransferase [Clostridiales bacterium]
MSKALLSSQNMNWCTPLDFFEELDREFHFDLDPAATEKSAKCAKYYTPEDDGLTKDWGRHRVFCNPPYGRQIQGWVQKGYKESRKPGTLVIMLIPARTDTQYFHDYILRGKADEVRFLCGRLKFTDEESNSKDAAPFPSAVIIWRSADMKEWTYVNTFFVQSIDIGPKPHKALKRNGA